MRILVSGTRHATIDRHAQIIGRAMREHKATGPHTLIHGACRGVDLICAAIAKHWGWEVESYPAKWDVHGRAAGVIRNQEMLDTGADLVLAFPIPGGRGTQDMIRRVRKARVPLTVTDLEV